MFLELHTKDILSNSEGQGKMLVSNKLDEYFDAPQIPNDITEEDIENIRNWMKAHAYLPTISDRQISIFLYCCDGINTTKTTIDNFYTLRTLSPDIFNGRCPEVFEEAFKAAYIFQLPELSTDNDRILFGGLASFEPEKLDVPHVIRLFFSLVDIYANLNPYTSGWRIVLDANGFIFGHFVKLMASLGIIKKAICYLQDAIQIRLKGIHIINASPLIAQFIGVIKPFMKKELYEMIQLFTSDDKDKFYEILHADSLPVEAGGKCGTIKELVQTSFDDLRKYNKWFEDDEKLARINESKRKQFVGNGPLVNEGSFRKLTID